MFSLIYWWLVTHIFIMELGHHWLKKWLVACWAPYHYLNQWSLIVDCNLRYKLLWNLDKYSKIFFMNNISGYIVCMMLDILFRSQCVNSLRPSDAYMRQWTNHHWFQIMACRLVGAKPLSEPLLEYCELDHWEQKSVKWTIGNKNQWNLNRNSNIFIQENAFENIVWKMTAILSRPKCVKKIFVKWWAQWLSASLRQWNYCCLALSHQLVVLSLSWSRGQRVIGEFQKPVPLNYRGMI